MTFTGGVRVALGDFTADGYPDVVTAPGPGGGPEVHVFDGKSGKQVPGVLGNFWAYDPTMTAGVQLAAGDFTGDGVIDIATAADWGGGPHVRVFDGKTGAQAANFFAFEESFTGGMRIALRDITGDGRADVVVGAGYGGAPRVRVLDAATLLPVAGPLGDFYAGDPDARGGVSVAAGDVTGDGETDLVTGAGVGEPAAVTVYDGVTGKAALTATAFPAPYAGGLRLGLAYVTDDDREDIVVGTVASAAARIRILDGATGQVTTGPAGDFDPGYGGGTYGVNLAAESDPITLAVTATPASRLVAEGQTAAVRVDVTASPQMTYTSYQASWGDGTYSSQSSSGAATTQYSGAVPHVYSAAAARTVTVSAFASYLRDSASASTTMDLKTVALPAPTAATSCTTQLYTNAAGGGGNVPSSRSSSGVLYGTGLVAVSATDYADPNAAPNATCPAPVSDLGIRDAYSSDPGYAAGGAGGNGWTDPGASRLVRTGSTLTLLGQACATQTFDGQGTPDSAGMYLVYKSRFADSFEVKYDAVNGWLTLDDKRGDKAKYYAFASAVTDGRFDSLTEPGGAVTAVTSRNLVGLPTEVQRSTTTGGVTAVDSLVTSYLSGSGPNAGRKSSSVARRQVGGGAWATVREADYDYYTPSEAGGTTGDLKLATVKDAAGNVLDQRYYRYYDGTTSAGLAGQMKYALGPVAYARAKADLGGTDGQVQVASDTTLAPYADTYLEYDSAGRATKAVTSGSGCSVCSGGQGSSTYAYTASANAPGMNAWAVKTVETLADGNTNTVYTNAYGEVMLRVYRETATGQDWRWYNQYDTAGRLVLSAQPSAVTGHDDTKDDLVNFVSGNAQYLADSAGLVSTTAYYASTTATDTAAGGVAGFVQSTAIRQGETGTDVPQSAMAYFEQTGGDATADVVASSTRYRNDDGTGAETTTTAYTWESGTAHATQVTTTLPAVTTAENGPGTATSTTTVFDDRGRVIWARDAGRFLSYTAYDPATGAVVESITDADTTQTADFAGLPSGWSTPTGGGLHLKTVSEVDLLGRATKMTSPNGRVDYTVFDDPGHEVRKYMGWDASANTPTGPTTLTRDDRAGGYSETLSFSAAPAVSGGRPTGAESVSGIQSLSRMFRNLAGQSVRTDGYYDLTGVTYSHAAATGMGSEGTNFLTTLQDYDHLGRPNRSRTAAGTITRTVYDGQGRPVSMWVGTSDTPATGYWSPANPAGMVKVSDTEYDGGGVGDGDATKLTRYPGLGAAARVAQTWYDWRDRAVAAKGGAEATESTDVNRPLTYTQFDNLSEPVSTERYDGDGVTPTVTAGVPDRPAAGLLRAKQGASYDELGQAYRQTTYSVDPATGAVAANTLHTDTWYDARGLVAKTAGPGGLTRKTTYDGAGRPIVAYTTDGGGDAGPADALTVTGDAVLEQAETQYDAEGNAITTTVRQRLDDATGTGALGTPNTGVPARVSYAATYFDLADRSVASVDFGTNGGVVWSRPAVVPARSDIELVTSTTYDAAGRAWDVTNPRGLVARTAYDLLGRATKTVENYVDGVPSDADDKTTEYGYGPAGMTSLTANLAGGGGETTQWVYGVTVAGGSGVDSNDVAAYSRWPDPSTGAASASQRDAETVNALGQTVTASDRNGTAHALTYDTLGRVTADAVTAIGTGVDGAVRRVETRYDGQGNAALVTTYSLSSGGVVTSQVKETYDGLGELASDWQAHGAAVGATTPRVQYGYSFVPSGTANQSRPTGMTYPDGRVVADDYGTASDLNDRIGRLSALKDGSTTLEEYGYLGLGTVVTRSHPESGVDLTYAKQAGEADGDAGDKYTGLDRFGRVVDQRWLTASTGAAVDRFQYGYDRDGNRLYRSNTVNAAFGEVYTYDGLNQATGMTRGTLNAANTGVTGTAARAQTFDYDAAGNFDGVTTDGTTQARTANKQNEVTSVGGATNPTFDAAGNMTGDETGRVLVYDAWNRLVAVKTAGGAYLASYGYDGLGRRVSETPGTGAATDLYYSSRWQVLEERVSGVAKASYVWSRVYVDALVARDRDADGSAATGAGGREERLYALQDANWNTTALMNTGGAVAERYAYDAFGAASVLDAGFAARSGGTGYAWRVLFQGMSYDATAGMSDQRSRWYSPTLGRWASTDPLGFAAADGNLYRFVNNDPFDRVDPSGDIPWPADGGDIDVIRASGGRPVTPVGYAYGPPTFKIDQTSFIISYPVYAYEAPRVAPGTDPIKTKDCKTCQLYAQRFFVSYINVNISVTNKTKDDAKALGYALSVVSFLMPGKWIIKTGKLVGSEAFKRMLRDYGDANQVNVDAMTTPWTDAYIVYYWVCDGKIAKSAPWGGGGPAGYVVFGASEFDKTDFSSNAELTTILNAKNRLFLGYGLTQ